MSREGDLREEEFYLYLQNQNDFFDGYIHMPCTDKQIKFFKSVINGNMKFVKHALNSGPIRNHHETMRAAVNLACRFGQARILDVLFEKVNVDFFMERNLNHVVVLNGGYSEARRMQANQEPSGVLDILLKSARRPAIFDEKTNKWVTGTPGKIDFNWTNGGELDVTPFMALCGTKNRCMDYVVKQIVEAGVVNIHEVFKETPLCIGVSALSIALSKGEKEVAKVILDKMNWKALVYIYNETASLNHVQLLLGYYLNVFSNQDQYIETVLPLPLPMGRDRMDIIQLLIEKCFRVTPSNKIGHNNDAFMEEYKRTLYIFGHGHFDSMIQEVIQEERRAAYLSDKITWYDLDNVMSQGDMFVTFHGDQGERYFRAINDYEEFTKLNVKLEKEQKEKKICWGCGEYFGSKLFQCKVCRKARYCDALCQDEDWKNHKDMCKRETTEEKESRKTKKNIEKQMLLAKERFRPGYSY